MPNKCQKWDENIKDARRNSEHFRRIQTFWGPLFDHFPDFNNFVKIGHDDDDRHTLDPTPPSSPSHTGTKTRCEAQDAHLDNMQ